MTTRTLQRLTVLLILLTTATTAQCQEQYRFSEYFEALPQFWDVIYAQGGETLYCGKKFNSRRGRGINIEHVLPMSWAMRAEGCRSRKSCRKKSSRFNRIEADMHNLYPARQEINKARSSFPFSIIKGERRQFGGCDFEVDKRQRKIEPRPEARGNIARAMFHMYDSYGVKIFRNQGKLLKRWHRQDPPDKNERRRNDRIHKLQGTRNRFIDEPKAADRLRF
ncbi:MAG: endonuclease [Sedimenticola sp.]